SHGPYAHGQDDGHGHIISVTPIGPHPRNEITGQTDNMGSNDPSEKDYPVWKDLAKGNPGFTGAIIGPGGTIKVWDSATNKTQSISRNPVEKPPKTDHDFVLREVTGSHIPEKVYSK